MIEKNTFMGRFNHNMDIIDPRTLFVSEVREFMVKNKR